MKTIKDFLKFKSGKVLDLKYPIELFDKSGNTIYFEDSNGYWCKYEFDKSGNKIHFEDSTGYWGKIEFDKSGNKVHFEDSDGHIEDNRPAKEMSVAEIEKALGHKVKVIK